jgi:hypothetical protein
MRDLVERLFAALPSVEWLDAIWTGICSNSVWDFIKTALRALIVAPAITLGGFAFRRQQPPTISADLCIQVIEASWREGFRDPEIPLLIKESIRMFRERTGRECFFEAYIFDASASKLVGIDIVGNGYPSLASRTFSVAMTDQPSDVGLSGQCFQENEPLLVEDRRRWGTYRTFNDSFAKKCGDCYSYILAPVRLKSASGQVVGVIAFASQRAFTFSRNDLAVLACIAKGFAGCFEFEIRRRDKAVSI